jgi:hypothetical protein
MRHSIVLAALGGLAVALASGPANSTSARGANHRGQHEASTTEQLNAESLQRARQGQDSPTPGPDTTRNLNRISEQDAKRGQPVPQPPMPFR